MEIAMTSGNSKPETRNSKLLLLGGTSETAPLALALAEAGFRLLVSTATEFRLDLPEHAHIERRSGPLDEKGMTALVRKKSISAIVDATHPYAETARLTARGAAGETGIPYFTLLRPGAVGEGDRVEQASGHREAARKACAAGRPVFVTTGTRNLAAYVKESLNSGSALVVRVLPESVEICRKLGIPGERIVAGRGPFTVDQNREIIRRFGIGVIVTKDSGARGGTPEKLAAARAEGCRVIVVARPAYDSSGVFAEIEDLVSAVKSCFPPS
jgi:precorrin-6A/cobalt-precorrin-6A reductase